MFQGDGGCKLSNKLAKREIWQQEGSYFAFENSFDNSEGLPNHCQKITLSSQRAWKTQSPDMGIRMVKFTSHY